MIFISLIRSLSVRGRVNYFAMTICILSVFVATDSRINAQQTAIQLANAENAVDRPKVTDFQIRIDIYSDDSKQPIASLKTLFTNGQYIELDDKEERHTVVDPVKGRITLLDEKKKELVHLDMHVIEAKLDDALKQMSAKQQSAFSSEGQPILESDNYISIGNKLIRYKFLPVSTKHEIAARYGDFADWMTRIKALYDSPKMPPQIRLELNKLLVDQSQLPKELRRTIIRGNKPDERIARLNLTESLSNTDRSRVASIYQMMQQFKPTSENEFFK